MVQWYDFKYVNDQSKYFRLDCPYLKMTNLYNLIPIESINEEVHIVLRFDKENCFLLNKYMF